MIVAMKESGIEWVGLIPDTWSVIPNKYVMHKEKNLCEKWTGEDVMSLTMNGVIVRDLQNPTGKMPATFDGYQYIEDGDLLMCLFDIDVTPRCVGRVTHDGVTSPAYSNFKMHDNASRDYFYYYYLMVDNTKELLHLAKNLRHSFTEEQLGQLKVPMPPLSEQQVIADYLDKTCSKIDEIIAEAKASIDEYKELKQSVIFEAVTKGLDKNVEFIDSGDEWLGKYPKSYSIGQLSILSNIVRGGSPRPAGDPRYYGGNIPFMRISDITKDDNIYVNSCENTITEEGLTRTRMIPSNTLLLTNSGATLGVPKINTFETTFNDGIAAFLDLDERLNIVYVYFFLKARTSYFLECASMGMGQPNLNTDIIGRTKIVFPTLVEQQKVVSYLEDRCGKLNSLIAEKESLINDLEAYKKSLIYEVVTGKRRVV